MFTALFQFFRAPTYEPVGPIFAFNVIRRGSAQGIAFWGLENLNLKFNWLNKSQKSKFYDDAYEKFLKILNWHNSGSMQDRVLIFDSRDGFSRTAYLTA